MSCEWKQCLSLICQSIYLLMQDHQELFPFIFMINSFQDSGSFDSLGHGVMVHLTELTYAAHVV